MSSCWRVTLKGEQMRQVLDRHGTHYRPDHLGWQKVRCINSGAHSHGDRNPSASVNVTEGAYTCFACGLKGDAYSLLMQLEGMDFKEAVSALGGDTEMREEPTWLTWR